MRSFGGVATKNRIKHECDRYVAENLEEIRYQLFCEVAQDDIRQAEAVFLWAMSLHGYGTKRLQQMHRWFVDALQMPNIMGQTPAATDCMELLADRHGIDFAETIVRLDREVMNDGQTD